VPGGPALRPTRREADLRALHASVDIGGSLDRFADGTNLLAHYVPTETGTLLRFGSDPKRFGDPIVRKAIELAIDRQSIVGAGAIVDEGAVLVAEHLPSADALPARS